MFVTIGKTMAELQDFPTAVYTWLGRFAVCHVDEATKVLQGCSLALPRFMALGGKKNPLRRYSAAARLQFSSVGRRRAHARGDGHSGAVEREARGAKQKARSKKH